VRTELEVIVDPDLYNNLKVRSRIALGHIQPVLKRDLDRKIGHLGPRDLDGVITRHLMNLGIIEG
jgi:hypothetical protein